MQTNPSHQAVTAILGMLFAGAALFAASRIAHAESVYKCRAADGAIAYQDRACASSAAESHVEIAAAPPVAPSPDYGRDTHEARRTMHGAASPRVAALPRATTHERRESVSYECRAGNGELFYRHGGCPGRITADAGSGKRGRGSASSTYAVTSQALPRGRIAAAGSIGRAGHARDESVSTYDRNLGRDPCRYE
jgi:uncharacterized protein DUF4124